MTLTDTEKVQLVADLQYEIIQSVWEENNIKQTNIHRRKEEKLRKLLLTTLLGRPPTKEEMEKSAGG